MLAFGVSMSTVTNFPLPTPVVAGLTLGLFVYTVGKISGAHLNPAVTIALLSVKKIKAREDLHYVIFQLIGGFIAFAAVQALYGSTGFELGFFGISTAQLLYAAAEAFGAFILAFGVSSVVYGKVDDDASGVVIGGSLLLGITMTSGVGILNPAVAVGLGVISWVHFLGPIFGAVVGAQVFKFLYK